MNAKRLIPLLFLAVSGCAHAYNKEYMKVVGPVNFAIEDRNYEEAKRLIEAGHEFINPPPVNRYGRNLPVRPAIAEAVQYKAPESFLLYLIERGADPSPGLQAAVGGKLSSRLTFSQGMSLTPIEMDQSEDTSRVQFLLDHGAQVNWQDPTFGWTALVVATASGHATEAAYLLERGADPEITTLRGWRPVIYAIASGHQEAAELLIDASRPLTDKEKDVLANLAQLCSRESGFQTGYAIVRAAVARTDYSGKQLADAAGMCFETGNSEYLAAYMSGARRGRTEVILEGVAQIASDAQGIINRSQAISQGRTGGPSGPEATSYDSGSGHDGTIAPSSHGGSRDKTRCAVHKFTCAKGCNPPSFGLDKNYDRINACRDECAAEYARCMGQ